MAKTIYRQGDVLIETVTSIPRDAQPVPHDPRGAVLAEGEATGHHHRIGPVFRHAKLYALDDAKFLDLRDCGGGAALTHEEHTTIHLPAGIYRATIQREYTPEEVQRVVD